MNNVSEFYFAATNPYIYTFVDADAAIQLLTKKDFKNAFFKLAVFVLSILFIHSDCIIMKKNYYLVTGHIARRGRKVGRKKSAFIFNYTAKKS